MRAVRGRLAQERPTLANTAHVTAERLGMYIQIDRRVEWEATHILNDISVLFLDSDVLAG